MPEVIIDGKKFRLEAEGWTHDGVKMVFQSPTRRWLEKGSAEGYHDWKQLFSLVPVED